MAAAVATTSAHRASVSKINLYIYPASRDLSYRHEERDERLVLRGDMRDLCSQGKVYNGRTRDLER